LSADHGVVPVPEDMAKTGVDAGVLIVPDLQERMEKALEPFQLHEARDRPYGRRKRVLFPGIYGRLEAGPRGAASSWWMRR